MKRSMKVHDPQHLAGAYAQLLDDILPSFGMAEDAAEEELGLSEIEVQSLWHIGLLGNEGDTCRHGHVRVLSFGKWNRGAGPDFLGAELEMNGRIVHGDIEIDPHPQDWERHGHGANPLYNHVVLHVTLSRPPEGWYTRNSLHLEIPVLYVPPQKVRRALGIAPPLDETQVRLCRKPLDDMATPQLQELLMAAAAHRVANKRRRFHYKAEVFGVSQAWYEAWAETLGYSANKNAMLTLARRAPLHLLGKHAEAILFGTAGFLVPMLPDKADIIARTYHKRVWGDWWQLREGFHLDPCRAIPWALTGIRPLNHPHRRVAALAMSAERWDRIEPLLNAAHAGQLTESLRSISHFFWDYRCTMTSLSLTRRANLVGQDRVSDFLINHVYVMDESPAAWEKYLTLHAPHPPKRVEEVAGHLFGERKDVAALLKLSYVQQGLLQIDADFCSAAACRRCLFPAQLRQWGL